MEKIMECQKCTTTLEQSTAIPVGQWTFCEACFRILLEAETTETDDQQHSEIADESPALEQPPSKDEEKTAQPPAVTSNEQTACCMLCDAAFDASSGLSGRLLQLCPACIENLLAPFEQAPEPEPKPKEEQVIQRRTFVHCAHCKRRIPTGGAKAINGKPFCPECHMKETELQLSLETNSRVTNSHVNSAPAKALAKAKTNGSCSACLQTLPTELVEGFTLCHPCRSTDMSLALELARARHHEVLRQMKIDLEQNRS